MRYFWMIFTSICFVLAPFLFSVADKQRGYVAVGGEIFIILLPLIVWASYSNLKNTRELINVKDEEND